MIEDYYDPQRAAKILSVSPEEVYEMIESGELDGEKEDGTWRIPSQAVHNKLSGPAEQDRRRALQDPRVEDLPPVPPAPSPIRG